MIFLVFVFFWIFGIIRFFIVVYKSILNDNLVIFNYIVVWYIFVDSDKEFNGFKDLERNKN